MCVWVGPVPQAALSWQRFLAATLMARDGAEWAKGIGTKSSGTYNNQYIVRVLGGGGLRAWRVHARDAFPAPFTWRIGSEAGPC